MRREMTVAHTAATGRRLYAIRLAYRQEHPAQICRPKLKPDGTEIQKLLTTPRYGFEMKLKVEEESEVMMDSELVSPRRTKQLKGPRTL